MATGRLRVSVCPWGHVQEWRAIKAYEAAGLLHPDTTAAPTHPPVDPDAGGLPDARSWCRWCGHRVVAAPGDHSRWVHHRPEGCASAEGVIEVPDCPDDEPWPANLEWSGP